MANTPNLQLPRLSASQSQKHVTHNEALDIIDSVCQLMVLDRDLATPPGSPADGDRYLVASSPTGAWTGAATKIAVRLDGAWEIITPKEGWQLWVADEDKLLIWNGSSWVDFGAGAGLVQSSSLTTGAITQLGINTSSSTTNRLAVASQAALFTTISDHMRITVNKTGSSNDASIFFQTGFSSRALFGLVGTDEFLFKFSHDGSTYNTGIRGHKDLHGRTMVKQALRRSESSWTPRPGVAAIDQLGIGVVTTGTLNSVSPSASNLFTQASRVKYTSAATAGASTGVNGSGLFLWRGNASSQGGFYLEMRFGIETFQSGSRGFAGLYSSASAIGNVNPSTLLNCVGVGWDASETTLRIMSNDGTSTATRTDLGANFPVSFGQSLFELILSADPNGSEIKYRVENLNSGQVASGILSTDLPVNTTFMTPHLWYNNGATAAAVEIALMGMYCENNSLCGSRGFIDS